MACALAAGARCLTDVEAISAQLALIDDDGGEAAVSDTTIWRVLAEFTARHGGALPAVHVAGRPLVHTYIDRDGKSSNVSVTVLRVDATLIDAASTKVHAAGTYRLGFGSST